MVRKSTSSCELITRLANLPPNSLAFHSFPLNYTDSIRFAVTDTQYTSDHLFDCFL